MKKSEDASRSTTFSARQTNAFQPEGLLPFSGLGFDLRPVLTRRIRLIVVQGEKARHVEPPRHGYVLPSGRWLQLRLGQEIRGR
jgi:hypothetical protein